MNILDRKLKQDLLNSWHMLLAVSSIIAVGIGCFIGMMSAAQNLESARSSFYSSCRLADFWIDVKKASIQEVQRLTNIRGISEIRHRIQFNITLDLNKFEKPIGAMVLSLPDEKSPIINNIILRQGTYFSYGRANEVIVSENFAKARDITPGDIIIAILNNQRKELIVVGTAISAEFVYMTAPGSMVNDPGSYGLLYIKRSFAEDTFGFNGASNSIIGLLAPEVKKNPESTINILAEALEPFGVFSNTPRSKQFSPMVLDGELTQLKNMAYMFPMFFLVVAALVLNVLMIRLTEQQRTVIGTLKAIGYENRLLTIHYIKFATTTGIVGGILGCLLGYWLGDVITRMYVEYFNFPQLTNRFYPILLLIGILISILFSVLGTLKGIRNILTLEPAEAMRQASPPVGKTVFLEKIHFLWALLDAQWHMIIRGLFRNKSRTFISIFSATLGSSIVILAFGFVDSMNEMVRLQFDTVLKSDYHLTFNNEINYSAFDEISKLPGVIHAEPVYNLPCTFKSANHSKKGVVTGINPNGQLTTPVNEFGNPIQLPSSGLLMTRRLMDQLHLTAGDFVEIIPVKGNKQPIKVVVAQGIESMLGLAVFADFNWLNKVVGQENVVSEVRILSSQSAIDKNKLMAAVKQIPKIEALNDIRGQKESFNAQLDGAMRGAAVVMILFAAVIFFGTILNGTLISISERRREMATFRTMGYYNNEVSRLFLRENLLTNLIGTLFGLALGRWMLFSSMKGFETDAYSFPPMLVSSSYIYTVLLAIVFVLISHFFVIRNLKNQNWVEALSLKE